ncbi:MAG: hypothetical protein HC869_26800 [Rhodospirillales bacterium]|nr:hypothetical protein [Rhodospirillales bacterium]
MTTVDQAGTEGKPAGWIWISVLGCYLLLLATITIYLAIKLWPDCQLVADVLTCDPIVFGFGPLTLSTPDIDQDERLFWTAVTFGAIGSYIHVAASFSDYVGNRRLVTSWIWWFVLRTPIGILLAVVFYVAIRAGFLTGSASSSTEVVNPFGIAAMSAMAGMFSKQASDKLNEVFTTLFKTTTDQKRGDKLASPAPKIESVTSSRAANDECSLAIKGSGFDGAAKVKVNGTDFTPTIVSPSEITVVLAGLIVPAGGSLNVVVKNPPEAGGDSAAVAVTVA